MKYVKFPIKTAIILFLEPHPIPLKKEPKGSIPAKRTRTTELSHKKKEGVSYLWTKYISNIDNDTFSALRNATNTITSTGRWG
jgi:hypothetical protein